jgi:transcriptional regulator with XRE-family HTH domain
MQAGITQTELAERTGIKRPNIARIEAGKHRPSLDTLEKIAEALNLTVAALVAAY